MADKDNNPVIVWVFGAISTGAAFVAAHLWTEIVDLNRRIDDITSAAQVEKARISECQNLSDKMIATEFESDRSKVHDIFVERGCVKVKLN